MTETSSKLGMTASCGERKKGFGFDRFGGAPQPELRQKTQTNASRAPDKPMASPGTAD